MKTRMPDIKSMTLREKIEQTAVVLMERGKKIGFTPGAAFFFGQIVTEAEDGGIDEMRDYVQAFVNGCDIPPLTEFENIDAFFQGAEEFYYKNELLELINRP